MSWCFREGKTKVGVGCFACTTTRHQVYARAVCQRVEKDKERCACVFTVCIYLCIVERERVPQPQWNSGKETAY